MGDWTSGSPLCPRDAHPSRDYMESGLLPARDLQVEGGVTESLWRKIWKRWEGGSENHLLSSAILSRVSEVS